MNSLSRYATVRVMAILTAALLGAALLPTLAATQPVPAGGLSLLAVTGAEAA